MKKTLLYTLLVSTTFIQTAVATTNKVSKPLVQRKLVNSPDTEAQSAGGAGLAQKFFGMYPKTIAVPAAVVTPFNAYKAKLEAQIGAKVKTAADYKDAKDGEHVLVHFTQLASIKDFNTNAILHLDFSGAGTSLTSKHYRGLPQGLKKLNLSDASGGVKIIAKDGKNPFRIIAEEVSFDDFSGVKVIGASFMVGSTAKKINLDGFKNVKYIGNHFLSKLQNLEEIDVSALSSVQVIRENFISDTKIKRIKGLENLFANSVDSSKKDRFGRNWGQTPLDPEVTQLTKILSLPHELPTNELQARFLANNPELEAVDLSFTARIYSTGADFLKDCTKLKSVDVSMAQLINIQDGFLSGCSAVTQVKLPTLVGREVEKIVGKDFERDFISDLTKLLIAPIGDNFMFACSSVTTLDVTPLKKVSKIGDNFLLGASKLNSLTGMRTWAPYKLTVGENFLAYTALSDVDLTPVVKTKEGKENSLLLDTPVKIVRVTLAAYSKGIRQVLFKAGFDIDMNQKIDTSQLTTEGGDMKNRNEVVVLTLPERRVK